MITAQGRARSFSRGFFKDLLPDQDELDINPQFQDDEETATAQNAQVVVDDCEVLETLAPAAPQVEEHTAPSALQTEATDKSAKFCDAQHQHITGDELTMTPAMNFTRIGQMSLSKS